jgi:hypothetical protein
LIDHGEALITCVLSASLALSTFSVKAGDSGDESGEPVNHLALFLGVTHAEEDDVAPTVGLDNERRVSEREDGENSGVLRDGAEYELEVGSGWSLAPALYFDIGEDDTKEVLDVAIGFSF